MSSINEQPTIDAEQPDVRSTTNKQSDDGATRPSMQKQRKTSMLNDWTVDADEQSKNGRQDDGWPERGH